MADDSSDARMEVEKDVPVSLTSGRLVRQGCSTVQSSGGPAAVSTPRDRIDASKCVYQWQRLMLTLGIASRNHIGDLSTDNVDRIMVRISNLEREIEQKTAQLNMLREAL